ncbi:hypothetical protein ANN_00508 [Periplaneta americana]|uniref:Uncharacterized protein n=1 Tax=Periplaneta americana TaxID=6978 RepID=A0ABQ8TQZ1_PERAM|nr:hypothetical protein ANN_00508 [Periplaneta americana]
MDTRCRPVRTVVQQGEIENIHASSYESTIVHCVFRGTAPRFTQPPIKLSTGSFPGVKGGRSVVPTTPPHSSAEVMESMGLYLHAPQVPSWHVTGIPLPLPLDVQFKVCNRNLSVPNLLSNGYKAAQKAILDILCSWSLNSGHFSDWTFFLGHFCIWTSFTLDGLEWTFNFSIQRQIVRGQAIIAELGVWKICARWVPRMLLPHVKQKRLDICEQLLLRYEREGDEFLKNIVTGDKSWEGFFASRLESKRDFYMKIGTCPVKSGHLATLPVPIKFKALPSAGKLMFTVFRDIQGLMKAASLVVKETNGKYRHRYFTLAVTNTSAQSSQNYRSAEITRSCDS